MNVKRLIADMSLKRNEVVGFVLVALAGLSFYAWWPLHLFDGALVVGAMMTLFVAGAAFVSGAFRRPQ